MKKNSIFIDCLTIISTFKILFNASSIKEVVLLNEINRREQIFKRLLLIRGISVIEEDFFAGHLKTQDNHNVMLESQNIANELSFVAAADLLNRSHKLNKINEFYGRNTVLLYITKQLCYDLRYWVSVIMVAHALKKNDVSVWIKQPYQFDKMIIENAFPDTELHFYSSRAASIIVIIKMVMIDVLKYFLLYYKRIKNKNTVYSAPKNNSVLMIQEDNVHGDLTLRGQPHWFDFSKDNSRFNTYILRILNSKTALVKNLDVLEKANIYLLGKDFFQTSMQNMKNNFILNKIKLSRYKTYREIFKSTNFADIYFLLKVATLQKQSELLAAVSLYTKSKVFLIRETYSFYSDAMMLVAPKIGVTTIAYQYSNINVKSPLMLATADKFLIFSKLYENVFQNKNIKPIKFIEVGYLYDNVSSLVMDKAKSHRKKLCDAGAEFVICYFDEAVQHDRWGLVNKNDHLDEIHTLANSVIKDSSMAVIIKSQFMFNSPSQLYPDDKLIQSAKNTGRLLEMKNGYHRNDIYPTEAALASDLCISHKFGATAAIEAVICGIRTVLLDPYDTQTDFDNIYDRVDVEYENIHMLMNAVNKYRQGDLSFKNLGDWSEIQDVFDPYLDGKSVERLRNEIESSLKDINCN